MRGGKTWNEEGKGGKVRDLASSHGTRFNQKGSFILDSFSRLCHVCLISIPSLLYLLFSSKQSGKSPPK